MQVLNEKVLNFCCLGCLNVFQILMNRPDGTVSDFKETDLYRTCVEFGLIPEIKIILRVEDLRRSRMGLHCRKQLREKTSPRK